VSDSVQLAILIMVTLQIKLAFFAPYGAKTREGGDFVAKQPRRSHERQEEDEGLYTYNIYKYIYIPCRMG
jgi:hypothetical protein